jgi:hypothetical protein
MRRCCAAVLRTTVQQLMQQAAGDPPSKINYFEVCGLTQCFKRRHGQLMMLLGFYQLQLHG